MMHRIDSLPEKLKRLIQGKDYTVDEIGQSDSIVMKFEDCILKIQDISEETTTEVKILKWLSGKLPVPEILYHAEENGTNYLLMSKVEGNMACEERYMDEPEKLISVLADALKLLWKVDVTKCPVTWDLNAKLLIACKNVENNLVDMEDAEPGTFGEDGFKNPKELYEWLLANKPEEEFILSHGDFCLPNIFIKDGNLSGYIDLGKMGVADKWLDIAICYRSLKHNYVGKFASKVYENFNPDLLFEKLGIEPDWEKIQYYILLDELF